jgi:Tol biopolymer transport system component
MRRAFLASCIYLLASCSPAPKPQWLYIFRHEPPALLQIGGDFSIQSEIPLNVPPECSLWDLYPQPSGGYLAIELSCPGGPTVVKMDTDSGELSTLLDEPVDSHFLAWDADGLYLRIDSLGNPRIVRVKPGPAAVKEIDINPLTYDLSPSPDGHAYTYAFSQGLGFGSELWLKTGLRKKRLLNDPSGIISFARWSPDGENLAYIRMPDSQTPFTVGELIMVDANGQNPVQLAAVDGGHGYEANWSPGGERIAFVKRENPEDERANQSASALVSNIYTVETKSGQVTSLTQMDNAVVETPHWSPDGLYVTFNVITNGTITVWITDMAKGKSEPVLRGATCCPAWMRK